ISGGLGSDSNADADMFLGSSGTHSQSLVEVGHDAEVTARRVQLHADMPLIKAEAISSTNAAALGANSDATSTLRSYLDALVAVRNGATVLGTELLEMIAKFDHLNTNADGHGSCDCGGGDTDATAENQQTTNALVVAEGSASVTTENLLVQSLAQVDRYRKHAQSDGGFLDFGGENENGSQDT